MTFKRAQSGPEEGPIVRIAAIALPATEASQIGKTSANQELAELDFGGELLNSCNRCPDRDTGRPPVDTESLEHEAPMIPIAKRQCISPARCRNSFDKTAPLSADLRMMIAR